MRMTRITSFLSPPSALIIIRNTRRNALIHHRVTLAPTSSSSIPRMVATEAARKKKKGGVKREKKGSGSAALAAALEKYVPVIGVEVHVQLNTRTKAFCSCSTRKSLLPNVHICPTCMGHPGALPVFNKKVAELAAKAGMALGCEIAERSEFDRKNYYYADTAKNYQITQARFPIATNGMVELSAANKQIRIERLHIEEDSAKMTHEGDGRLGDSTASYVDFNRAGIPLIEIVSAPDLSSGSEAAEYGQELQRILRHVGASDCNMQDGSLRCDVNVSIRPKTSTEYGTRVELKNLNSFASVAKSVDVEIERQAALLDGGSLVTQETRTWDEKEGKTILMRTKEESADYRYFPEPDLPPLIINSETLQEWRESLPELPSEKRQRFREDYGLSEYDAFLLADDVNIAMYLDDTVALGTDAKAAANWIMGDITKVLKHDKISINECKLRPTQLAELVSLIDNGTISGKIAKDLIIELVTQGGEPVRIVEERDLAMISDPEKIKMIVQTVLDENGKKFDEYKAGKTKLFGFFVGQVMKSSDGRADPKALNGILRTMLDS